MSPKYIVYFEKHVSKAVMRYGCYDTFFEAEEACHYLKSVNTLDFVWIDESHFRSGLNQGPCLKYPLVSQQQLTNIDTAIAKLAAVKPGKAWYNRVVFSN